MNFFRKASFLFPQKFLRRSDKAFVGLSCVFNDVVAGICYSFVVEPVFLYMKHCCDIEIQWLYIYDTNIEVFCISMSSPICVLHYEWLLCISMYPKRYKCFCSIILSNTTLILSYKCIYILSELSTLRICFWFFGKSR